MALTPAAVYKLARAAGFDPATAVIMTAIAGGESGWNPDAVGDVGLQDATWGPSVGLWQIRSIKAQNGSGGVRDASRLKDPAFNARSAYAIYQSQGLRAWSVYTNGAYRRFLDQAQGASGSSTSGGSSGAATAIAFARAQIGKPYRYGATGPNEWDCSGLVQAAWRAAGVELPRTTYTQILAGTGVNRDSLAPGDLIFPNPGHVQLYIGGGRIIEAPRTGVPVREGDLGGMIAARRVGPAGGSDGSVVNAGLGAGAAQLIDLPGGNWNPLNWPGAILGNTVGSTAGLLWAQIQPFLLTGTVVAAGLGLVVLGVGITAWPVMRRGVDTAKDLVL